MINSQGSDALPGRMKALVLLHRRWKGAVIGTAHHLRLQVFRRNTGYTHWKSSFGRIKSQRKVRNQLRQANFFYGNGLYWHTQGSGRIVLNEFLKFAETRGAKLTAKQADKTEILLPPQRGKHGLENLSQGSGVKFRRPSSDHCQLELSSRSAATEMAFSQSLLWWVQ